MDGRGSWTLGEISARQGMIEIACWKCERRGRLRTAPLLKRYGPELQMPDLLPLLAEGCPRLGAVSIHDRFGAYYLPPP